MEIVREKALPVPAAELLRLAAGFDTYRQQQVGKLRWYEALLGSHRNWPELHKVCDDGILGRISMRYGRGYLGVHFRITVVDRQRLRIRTSIDRSAADLVLPAVAIMVAFLATGGSLRVMAWTSGGVGLAALLFERSSRRVLREAADTIEQFLNGLAAPVD